MNTFHPPINISKDSMKDTMKKAPIYGIAFLIPFLLLFLVGFIYNSGFGNPYTDILSLSFIFWNGLAGTCFLYYVRHTKTASVSSIQWQLLLSCAYGLCSYAIIQENSISSLCVYAIFPIVFLSFEAMITGSKYLPFLLLGALTLILDPECAIPIFLLLIILAIGELKLKHQCSFGNLCHHLSCIALVFLLAAFRIAPHLEASVSGYSGYDTICSPLVFLSRFLPGSTASISYYNPNGIDIYFGLFFLIPFFLFFFIRNIGGTKRRFYAVFTLITIGAMCISPVRYIFNLFTETSSFSLSYSFFLIFWCLKLATEALSHLSAVKNRELHGAVGLTALLILSSWIGGFHNFHTYAFPAIMLLFAVFAILLYGNQLAEGNKKILQTLLFPLILAEFFCNCLVITNMDLIPSDRNLTSTYIWELPQISNEFQDTIPSDQTQAAPADTEAETASTANPLANQEEYQAFYSTHANAEVIDTISKLMYTVPLETAELETYSKTALPNQLEVFNAQCHKLGIEEDLFTPFDIDITLTDSEFYTFSTIYENIYNVEFTQTTSTETYYYFPFQLDTAKTLPANLYLYNSNTGELLQLTDSKGQNTYSGYMRLLNMVNANTNFQLLTCVLNEELAKELPMLLENYEKEVINSSSLIFCVYIGMGLSCIGLLIMLTLFFNSDKKKVYQVLLSWKKALDHWKFPGMLAAHVKKNRIYYLAFFIPILFFVGMMLVTDCIPFGANSFFDEDGIALTVPSYMDIYYSLTDNNTYLSMNGGYGSSIYANTPIIQLFSFYRLFSPEQIAPLLLFGEAFCLGLCGLAMAFYMTHRLHDTRAHKEDYRLLIPAMIYTLNAYMLSMHNYTGWYFTLFAFPLLMLAMDYLMYKKKTLPYVLLLTYCIITNLYLSLYMCIFLVIYFLMCNFQGIKDFFHKGIRFALCSLLAAGNSFFIISNTLLSSYDSPYSIEDSVFPAFGLFTNFLEQWKKHMIFTTAKSISSDNGLLNIYCGILTLLLVLLYFSAKQVSLKAKLKKLLPILFLYISFNEQVLSYIWGGLHYQTKVPNRFVFLLLFLLAEISYDSICQIEKVSVRKYTLFTVILAGFFLICQFCSDGNTTLSWVSTLILCGLYLTLHILFTKYKQALYPKLLVAFLILELGANMVYATKNYSLTFFRYYGDYTATAEYINEYLTEDGKYFRISFPTTWLSNSGQLYHTGSNSLFNSFVTLHQDALNSIYGFYFGGNMITSNYASSPLLMSLSGSRYIFLPIYATGKIEDIEQYEYLGPLDYYYVFENPNALSLGIYAPEEISRLTSLDFTPQFFNDLVSLYTNTEDGVFIPQYVGYSDDINAADSFYFTDGQGNKFSYEEAVDAYRNYSGGTSYSCLRDFCMHINYTPTHDGFVYLCCSELVALGKGNAGVAVSKTINFPNSISYIDQGFNFIVLDEAVLNNFYEKASKNQLENIQIANDTITGTTNYEKDGYTMLSLAYDRSWHAYIDGNEVGIEDPYGSFMLVKTPAGKHTLELKYVPYGMKTSKCITFGFWILTLIIYVAAHKIKRRKTLSPSE